MSISLPLGLNWRQSIFHINKSENVVLKQWRDGDILKFCDFKLDVAFLSEKHLPFYLLFRITLPFAVLQCHVSQAKKI